MLQGLPHGAVQAGRKKRRGGGKGRLRGFSADRGIPEPCEDDRRGHRRTFRPRAGHGDDAPVRGHGRGKGFQGESYYNAPNPKVGAVFTYYYQEDLKSEKDKRKDEESKLAKDGKDVFYPTYDKLKAEQDEE